MRIWVPHKLMLSARPKRQPHGNLFWLRDHTFFFAKSSSACAVKFNNFTHDLGEL